MRLYSAAAQPASSTSASHVLCRRSGVKPKQSIYSASFDNAITANSMLSASSVTHRARLTLRSLTGGLLIRVTSHSSTKFSAMTRHSSKKPCRAYSATVKSTGSVRVNAPNGYYQPGNTYDDLNPVLIKLGYTNSLGVYVEENFAYLLAPDCSYADLEELSNLANEAIGAQMKYPNDVNNMYRNTYNAYPLSKVWNFYTRSWS